MSGIALRCLAACTLLGMVASSQASTDDRKPDEILAEVEAVALPAFDQDRRDDPEYVQEYPGQLKKASERRAELIGELYRAEPEHPRLSELLPERWMTLKGSPETQQQASDEMEAIITDESSPLRVEAAYVKANSASRWLSSPATADEVLGAIDAFIAIAPGDDRGASLLYRVARHGAGIGIDAEQQEALMARVRDEYPDSPAAAKIAAKRRQSEGVGKPFELTFNDVMTDKTISVQDDLKGKFIVVDFWATWCGPCITEMPKMKQLYAEYKSQGVEFIGVSLDQPEDEGGLDALKRYVRENEIEWPQYYQGDGWEGEFSRSWGIDAIPALFVIDQQGNLHSNQARGQLETMIPELLRKGIERGED